MHSGQRASFSTAVCFVHIYPVTKCAEHGVTKGLGGEKSRFREFILRACE